MIAVWLRLSANLVRFSLLFGFCRSFLQPRPRPLRLRLRLPLPPCFLFMVWHYSNISNISHP